MGTIFSSLAEDGTRAHSGEITLPGGRQVSVTWHGAATIGHIDVPARWLRRASYATKDAVFGMADALAGRDDLDWEFVAA